MVPATAMQVPGRGHSPVLALIAGLLIPGAGQAYNGQSVKGAFLLFTTPLVVPWIYSVIDGKREEATVAWTLEKSSPRE